jgi:TolA-binding protein
MRPLRLSALGLLVVASSGCLATKGHMVQLQEEMRSSRAAATTADAARRAQTDSIARATAAVLTTLATRLDRIEAAQRARLDSLRDSVRAVSRRLDQLSASTAGSLRSLTADVERLTAVVQNAQQVSATLRADMEESRRLLAQISAARAALPDSTAVAAADLPGPAQLMEQARTLLVQQAYGQARMNAEKLVQSYPNDNLVPAAYLLIAESWWFGGNIANADSVYALVVTQFPQQREHAATALFKRGQLADDNNRRSDADRFWNQVIREYPRTEGAAAACRKINRPNC